MEIPMFKLWTARAVGIIALSLSLVTTIGAQSINDLEVERTKQLQEMGVLLPNPQEIIASAQQEFSKDIQAQDASALKKIAEQANHYANLVDKIYGEYTDYLRDNSRYDFVTEEVRKATLLGVLEDKDTEFKTIRNQAYINLGRLAQEDGKDMEAFLFFNDAFRLSTFSCYQGQDKCLRYQAEQYMKKLLGVEGDSYVYWKKWPNSRPSHSINSASPVASVSTIRC